jgi:hypothetical protein
LSYGRETLRNGIPIVIRAAQLTTIEVEETTTKNLPIVMNTLYDHLTLARSACNLFSQLKSKKLKL